LDTRPLGGLGPGRRGVDRRLHDGDGAGQIAVQLAGVGHPGVAGLIGPQVDHLLECRDRLVVAAELRVCVAEDTVARRLVLVAGDGPLAPVHGVLKLVAGQGERAQADQRVGVFGRQGQRLLQDALGARVVRRVTRFASALQVGQAEQGRAALVAAILAQALLQGADLAIGGRDAASYDIRRGDARGRGRPRGELRRDHGADHQADPEQCRGDGDQRRDAPAGVQRE
jgi:hypothetical protein